MKTMTEEASSDSENRRIIRVVLGKKHFDAHDVGLRYIAHALTSAGMEVVFMRFAETWQLAAAAADEDADVIGISILTGAHLSEAEALIAACRERGLDDRLIIMGGVIADDDIPALEAIGIERVFQPGTSPDDLVKYIQERVVQTA